MAVNPPARPPRWAGREYGKCERAAVARFAADIDVTAHQFDETPANGESETGAAENARRRCVRLSERVEQAGLLFRGDADSLINDFKLEPDGIRRRFFHSRTDDDVAASRKFDGVA